jgi:acyl-CoA reductase-like NAD-dependent aldehyde dehydrogenase
VILRDKVFSLIREFVTRGGTGPDPFTAIYPERRKSWSLFTPLLPETDLGELRPYLFCYNQLPETPEDTPVTSLNFIDGQWQPAARGELAEMPALFDHQVKLSRLARSGAADVEKAIAAGHHFWRSLEWANETLSYRKWVVKNFSRILNYYVEDCLREIRHQIPKTRLEAEKDFWEAKRSADHLEGSAEQVMQARQFPSMIEGHNYWKNYYLPAGLAVILTPMNFIYGIPVIQMIGCYLAGAPFIFKGHPFAAITNTTLVRMLLAAGADPRAIQKIEGFGKEITGLTSDPRVAVVSVTGSEETAKQIQRHRSLRPLRFEGGGCNWAWVDDRFTEDQLRKIVTRLTYSKLSLSSHKCTTLHGVAATRPTLDRLTALFAIECDKWEIADPRKTDNPNVLGPVMVHKAINATLIQEQAARAGVKVVRLGGEFIGTAYARHAEVVSPVILSGVKPDTTITINWDGKGNRTFKLATTELFLPVLCLMESSFEEFVNFCLFENPHDLSTVIYTLDDSKLQRARKLLGGMLKENDGTDSALEWEDFGASGIGDSGNSGVGDAEATISIFCRKQKGRHVVFH